MRRGTLNLLLSLLFIAVAVIAFVSVWRQVQTQTTTTAATTFTAIPNVTDIKTQADSLFSTYENNANLPVKTPTDKLNKPNPFTAPE